MGLTSQNLVLFLVCVAVAICALVLWLWPRVARKGVLAVASRLSLLLLSQVGILALLLVVANNEFGFYSTWNELLGRNSSHQELQRTEGGKRAPALVVKGQESVGLGPKEKAGRVDRIQIHGPVTGFSMDGYAYLPPQYFQKGHEKDRFPVIVAVTGQPGLSKNLITQIKVPQAASTAIVKKQMRPTIVLMVRPSVVANRDTNCTDVPGGPQALAFFNQDLPIAVNDVYRADNSKGAWGAVGNSTGGYCALKMAMTNPARYGAAAGLSADFFARQDRDTGDLYAGNKQIKNESDLVWRLAHMPPPPVSLLVGISKKGEEKYYKQAMHFTQKAKAPTKVDTLLRDEGGHNFQTWREEYPEVLRWLDKELAAGH
ncbi:alpha/beta hydrolase [Streptomyces caatingaensis]|uniref:Membrane protein n=1 Tax=Streptomyces caatingaensis TaxID=1678637 RepID=A0A0K9XG23_9ACTN|nr:alpha/beta hydrolase-fold protein [Streptomyces caatingaensis]KNB52330.1 membrane protein [Streptomyces caatingaensis]